MTETPPETRAHPDRKPDPEADDLVRILFRSAQATKEARQHPDYVSALARGQNPPTPEAFLLALKLGRTGTAALEAARRIDTLAENTTAPIDPDDLPPFAA